MMDHGFIFFDKDGRRWRRLRILFACAVCAFFISLVFFFKTIIVCPRLSGVQQLSDITKSLKALHTHYQGHPDQSRMPPAWMKTAPHNPHVRPWSQTQPGQVRLGFYSGWDPAGFASLEKNGEHLTHLAPEWFFVAGIPPVLSETPDKRVLAYAREHDIKLLPQLTNLHGTWQPEAIEALIQQDKQRRSAFFTMLVQKLTDIDAAGAVVDFQEVDPAHKDAFTEYMLMLSAALHKAGLELWLCIPPGNDVAVYDLDGLAGGVDRFVALLFDENGEQDSPGPIASVPWFRAWLEVLTAHGDPQQWVIGIGAYGYDWQEGRPADTIGFSDCMARAAHAGEEAIEDDQVFSGPSFTYELSGKAHTVWFLDAITLHNHAACAAAKGTGGIALYRLGCEDPAVWEVLARTGPLPPEPFEKIASGGMPAHIGDGDFLTASDERSDGKRLITADGSGLWRMRYVAFPRYPLLVHRGADAAAGVALTFDDGPDPEWTPRILDVLKTHGVSATFFVTGLNARQHPDLVRRIVAEGHALGNHTYNHVELTGMPAPFVQLEINATQRILEGITGRSTILFRPPYNADRRPGSIEDIHPLVLATGLGYITVCQSIDSEDWNAADAETILERIKERRPEGSVVLLHDAGGDRAATVAALPLVIRHLRRRGDQIVPLHRLLDMPAASLMPQAAPADGTEDVRVAYTGFRLMHWFEQVCWAFMIVTTGLVFCRTLLLAALAMRNKRRARRAHADFSPPVSVLIAAHNEQRVIEATLRSVLATAYLEPFEVIVIDDGSNDATAAIVRRIADQDARVRLITQQKQGKAAALNAGLEAAAYGHIVTLDADTQLLPDTIGALVQPFADPAVGAVSGHVRVGNTGSWLTKFQELEYICGFNLDRRAYDQWNCITVVPGALSAFRRDALLQAGGLSRDTLAEDTDLTLTLHRLGYRLRFASDACALTEAPDTLRGLTRQRVRWAFGTLQCLYKHRAVLCSSVNKALGYFSIPGVWLFHFFLVAIIPCVDIMLIISLATGAGRAVADYAAAFIALDLLIAAAACRIDGTPVRTAWRILPMRFLYRPVLAWAVWAALLRAVKGVWVGWGRQERRGEQMVCIGACRMDTE